MAIKYAKRMDNIKGSAIRELLKLTEQPEIISFAGGLPAPELFPIESLKEVCLKVLDTDGKAALQYSPTEGYVPLRKIISERLGRLGIDISFENILITSGSQQGLEFCARVFVDEGDTIICESPSYLGALNAFKAYLPKFVEVKMDEDGMKMDELEKALKENPNAKFIYTIPDFQNPTGITMSLDRRKKIVELAEQYNVPVVEDNPYGDLRFDGEKHPPISCFDTKGLVIYLGTFSKIFAPGLRLGWVAASPEITQKYVLVKQGADLQTNSMSQREIATYIETNDIDAHIEKIIKVYRKRRDLMLETMKQEFTNNVSYTYPNGGLFTWVTLPEGIDAADVLQKALEEKVAFVPGGSFYPNPGNENHFRLNYSNMPEDKIVEGITRLGKVLKVL
ncbi:MAG: PLP-dependent aminotransferase family protein [Clostridiales bacterium]|nr:PLP-dependent aminotransferase family protein [Clostridiales bacterium]